MDRHYSHDYLLGRVPVQVCLLGDRTNRGGKRVFLRYVWFEGLHTKYGDDRWFETSLVENFVLNDLSNVYFGFYVRNQPSAFDIWIDTLQLHFKALSS